jgi:hypothetical protein
MDHNPRRRGGKTLVAAVLVAAALGFISAPAAPDAPENGVLVSAAAHPDPVGEPDFLDPGLTYY